MATYNVTNEAKGARFIGTFLIEPGATAEGVELAEDDAILLGDLDGVTVKEAKAAPKAEPKAEVKEPK